MFDEFEALDTAVIAVAQEDKSLAEFGQMVDKLGPDLPFEMVADLDREATPAYDRTTAYLIDKQGVVREIFPMIIHARPSWKVIRREVEALEAAQAR